MHYWGKAEVHRHTHCPLNLEKVAAWCARRRDAIIWLHFSEERKENSVTMDDTNRYIALILTKCISALKRRGVEMKTVIYQQDIASSHCLDRSLDSWHNALTCLGQPTPLISIQPTSFSGGTSRKISMTIIPSPDSVERQYMKGNKTHTSWN